MKKIVAFSALFLMVTAMMVSANQEFRQKAKFAQKEDILGTWQMVYQVIQPEYRSDSLFFSNYQMWEFSDDGFVKNIASTKPQKLAETLSAFTTMPKKTAFSFTKKGYMVIKRSYKDTDTIIISLMNQDMAKSIRPNAPVLEEGDLILSYLGPENRVYMQRFLRRVK